VLSLTVAGKIIIGVVDLVLKEVMLMIVIVLLKTLTLILSPGILTAIVKHGLVIIQILMVLSVNNLLLVVWQTVILVQMLVLVMNVLLVSPGMDSGVKQIKLSIVRLTVLNVLISTHVMFVFKVSPI